MEPVLFGPSAKNGQYSTNFVLEFDSLTFESAELKINFESITVALTRRMISESP
jgi:hypothetical protein